MRKHLRANFIVVHRHEYFPPLFVEFDLSKTRFDNPVLFLTRSNAWRQVMPCNSPPVMIVQLRLMLEPGSTVIGSVWLWHPDREQEDFISHFISIANEASVEWIENNINTYSPCIGREQSTSTVVVVEDDYFEPITKLRDKRGYFKFVAPFHIMYFYSWKFFQI